MANNNEMILLPVNEPTFGTKRSAWGPPGGPDWAGGAPRGGSRRAACVAGRHLQFFPIFPPPHPNPHRSPPAPCRSKSQIQTFLEQNEGPGLQHVALKTDDIIGTMRQMRARWAGVPGRALMPVKGACAAALLMLDPLSPPCAVPYLCPQVGAGRL